ncbi:Tectonin domain [Pelomyxa schiedti]|nr:Tectonin domain [Pelomyxa schiedti]
MTALTPAEWVPIEGNLKCVESDANGNLWGVNRCDEIYFRRPYSPGWTRVPGGLKQVSVAPGAGGGPHVWGVNAHSQVYARTGCTDMDPMGSGWLHVPAPAMQHVSPDEAGNVWGCSETDVYFKPSRDPGWVRVGGQLCVLSAGPRFQLWGCNRFDEIYVRTGTSAENPMGSGWVLVEGKCVWISVGSRHAVCCNRGFKVYKRLGLSPATPTGTHWDQIPGAMKQVHINQYGLVIGCTYEGDQILYTNFH